MITQDLYIKYYFCPRWAYYLAHNHDQIDLNIKNDTFIKRDQELLKEYAKTLFPNIVDVSYNFDDSCDDNYLSSFNKTKVLLNTSDCILNATFIYEDLCCRVDVLAKNNDGTFDIYKLESDSMSMDMAFQNASYNDPMLHFQIYVLRKCGLKIRFCHYLCLNKFYQKKDNINPFQLFIPCLKAGRDWKQDEEIEKQLNIIRKNLNQEKEPSLGHNCSLDKCPFSKFCYKDMPDFPIMIKLLSYLYAYRCFRERILTLSDLANNIDILLEKQIIPPHKIDAIKRVWQAQTSSPYVERDILKKGINQLKYPICYLELKTISDSTPQTTMATPYQDIIFIYSLYIKENRDAKIIHKEFLCNNISEESKLIDQLCNDIPQGSTIVYYKNFEYDNLFGKSGSLIEQYPKYAARFIELEQNSLCLHSNVFHDYLYYDKTQNGSTELNVILSVLAPEISKEIQNFQIVKNDNDLIETFIKFADLPEGKQKDDMKKAMLMYCDKLAQGTMFILNKLTSIVNKK